MHPTTPTAGTLHRTNYILILVSLIAIVVRICFPNDVCGIDDCFFIYVVICCGDSGGGGGDGCCYIFWFAENFRSGYKRIYGNFTCWSTLIFSLSPRAPVAHVGIAALKKRLASSLGSQLSSLSRIRILPPLEEKLYRALLKGAVAVLDPFPVGRHVEIYDALLNDIPVVTAPHMQECTSSYADSLMQELQLGPYYLHYIESSNHTQIPLPGKEFNTAASFTWPITAEEFVVFAIRLQTDAALRKTFSYTSVQAREQQTKNADSSMPVRPEKASTHGAQFVDFLSKIF
jgi:hypothetical protein